jgi:hypothetical protein
MESLYRHISDSVVSNWVSHLSNSKINDIAQLNCSKSYTQSKVTLQLLYHAETSDFAQAVQACHKRMSEGGKFCNSQGVTLL